MRYLVARSSVPPKLVTNWDDPTWQCAATIDIAHFHPRGSDHRPTTRARMLYDGRQLYLMFDVHDRFVRCVRTEYQSGVSRDSCIEFFLQPRPDHPEPDRRGYFNFEINCGGTLLVYYITDPARGEGDQLFREYEVLPPEFGAAVEIVTTLPRVVEPEITQPTRWGVACRVPLEILESYVGEIADPAGQTWRGNFFKCGDETSHPHWASWNPIGEVLRFHQPQYFGEIQFAP
jgi:hypothetical protein